MGAAPNIKPQSSQGFLELPKSASGIIYGPFASAPFGLHLGVNPLGGGTKVCSFDCPYCDLGRTTLRLNRLKSDIALPSPVDIENEILQALQKIHAEGPAVDGITVSGNGEPTLHPEFPDIAKAIMNARDLWLPGKPVVLITNGAGLDTRKVADAANLFTERVVKIDCGSERLFKAVNAPLSRANLARVLAGCRKVKDVRVQSMFFGGTITNTGASDLEDWIEVIAILKPKAVHIQGLSRKPAVEGLVACDEDTLYAIASKLERKTQIKATVE